MNENQETSEFGRYVALRLIALGSIIALVISLSLLVPSEGALIPEAGKVAIESDILIRQTNQVNYTFPSGLLVDYFIVGSNFIEFDNFRIQSAISSGWMGVQLDYYAPSVASEGALVLAMQCESSSETATSNFTLSGLRPDQKYMLRIDGAVGSQYRASTLGILSFSYSGPWSTHTFSLYVYYDGGAEGDELIADFTYEVSGSIVKFYDDSSGYNIVGWSWDFGDGSASTAQDPTHNYHEAGSYYVRFTVVDAEGLTDATTKLIVVGEPDQPFGLDLVQLVFAFGLIFVGLVIIIASRRPTGAIVGIASVVAGVIVIFAG